jgi:hypothetical protein
MWRGSVFRIPLPYSQNSDKIIYINNEIRHILNTAYDPMTAGGILNECIRNEIQNGSRKL